jgi:cobalt-zinc-cadmium efflux system outer membrane protein
LILLGLLVPTGCYYPVRDKIDAVVCDIAKQPFDVQKLEAADQLPIMPSAEDEKIKQTAYRPDGNELVQKGSDNQRPDKGNERPKSNEDLKLFELEQLKVPPDLLPTGPPRELNLGKLTKENAAKRREILLREFRPLQPPGPDYEGVPGPFGHPLTLAELQRLGMSSAPQIKQAVAAVESARGTAYQAGLLPNPIMGFEVDTFGTTGGAGYAGGYFDQLIKTAGKLRLSKAIAAMDLRNAEVALRRAQMDLATKIRTYYFQLLVAREAMRINRLVVAFTNAVYETQAAQVRGRIEIGTAYDPMYLRALADTALTNLVTARNSYVTAWKQLSSVLGMPGMPLTQVAGGVDTPIPAFDFGKVWKHVESSHTEVMTAMNNLQESRFALRLAQVQPYPDVDVRFLIQKDYTGPPNEIAPSIAVSIPVPIWNRNQGGIAAAQANVISAANEPARVRNDLYYRLSDATNRYRTFHQNLRIYRERILPDLVRVYNAIYRRYRTEGTARPPDPAGAGGLPPAVAITTPVLNDVVVAQQILTTSIASYLTNLAGMWQAVVDVTDLVQTPNLFQMDGKAIPTESLPSLPTLEKLKPLLMPSPCSPLPDPRLREGDPTWPEAVPTKDNPTMPLADGQARQTQPARPAAVVSQTPKTLAPAPPKTETLPDLGSTARALPTRLPLKTHSTEGQPTDPALLEPPPPVSGTAKPAALAPGG